MHGKPFEIHWPQGYATYAIAAAKIALEDDTLGKQSNGDIRNIGALLLKKPLCCRLTKERLLELYVDVHQLLNAKRSASPWKKARCQVCGSKKLGGPVRFESVQAGKQEFDHLCFHCLIFETRVDPNQN